MKQYKKYLQEKELEVTKVHPDDVEALKSDIVDISKPVKSADDYLDSNSPVLDAYGDGKGFEISDSADLYEVTKLIKDLLDKHLYVQSFQYGLDVNGNKVTFTGTTEGQDITDATLVQAIDNTVKALVDKRYPGGYKFESEVTAINGGLNKYQIVMTIAGKEPKAEKGDK